MVSMDQSETFLYSPRLRRESINLLPPSAMLKCMVIGVFAKAFLSILSEYDYDMADILDKTLQSKSYFDPFAQYMGPGCSSCRCMAQ